MDQVIQCCKSNPNEQEIQMVFSNCISHIGSEITFIKGDITSDDKIKCLEWLLSQISNWSIKCRSDDSF